MYLDQRKEDAAHDTKKSIRPAIDFFVEWCEVEGIENMNILGGRELLQFKSHCKENKEQNTVSLNGLLSTLRRFLVFCTQIEAVNSELPDKVPLSNVPNDEEVCYDKPENEQVTQVVQFLEDYEPASRRHVEYAIIKEIGNRVGAIRGIDIEDIDLESRVIKFRHRPHKEYEGKKGTPLKNKSDGERSVNISRDLADLIQLYLNNPDRPNVTDKFGRKPLLTTKNGNRPETKTIRQDFYKLTRPCEYADHCPHNRDIRTCEATKNNHASKCPSSHSPHPLRRWSIENQIERGVPKDELADRVDVSVPVLNKHYDLRSEERKRKQRLKTYEKLFSGYGEEEATLTETEHKAITNDDGTIDAVGLKQVITNGEQNQDVLPMYSDDPDNEDSDQEGTDEQQRSFDYFTDSSTGIVHPGLIPVIITSWVPRRFYREMESMSPESDGSSWPNKTRMVKGLAAYALYVGMTAVNLILIGVLPM